MISVDVSLKSNMCAKKDYILNSRTCICEISAYVKLTNDDAKIVFDEIINVINKFC